MWTDVRLAWEPSLYQRVHVIHVPVTDLWQPDVSVYNRWLYCDSYDFTTNFVVCILAINYFEVKLL